jgi:hypothetical protein
MRRDDKATLAQYGFRDYRRDGFGRHHAFEGVLQMVRTMQFAIRIGQIVGAPITISVWNAIDIRSKWFKARFIRMSFAGK